MAAPIAPPRTPPRALLLFAAALAITAGLLLLRWMPIAVLPDGTLHSGGTAAADAATALAPLLSHGTAGSSGDTLRRSLGAALERLHAGDARLIYYHVHKSGGSSMCNALVKANASLLGCIDEHKDMVVSDRTVAWCNCNGHRDLIPTPIAVAAPSEVEQYLQQRRPVAFFNEDGVADSPYWGPAALHAIIVRHPIQRYVSHMLHVLVKEDNRSLETIDVSTEVLRHSSRPPGNEGGIVDNYLTRYAAGWTALGRPTKAGVWGVGEVPPMGWELFLTALRNLERMQVVLVLEEIGDAAELLEELGLPPYSDETRAGTNFSTTVVNRQLSPEALTHLEQQHEWDAMLYAWCQQRHHLTLQNFRQLQQEDTADAGRQRRIQVTFTVGT